MCICTAFPEINKNKRVIPAETVIYNKQATKLSCMQFYSPLEMLACFINRSNLNVAVQAHFQ